MSGNQNQLTVFLLLIVVALTANCKEPKNPLFSINADVCSHYNAADATIVKLTDQYYPPDHHMVRDSDNKYGAAWAEFLAFKYDISLHVFERSIKGDAFEDFLATGRGGASVYYPSCLEPYKKKKLMSIRDDIEDVYGKSVSTLSYGCGKTDYLGALPEDMLGGRNSIYTLDAKKEDAITWYGENLGYKNNLNFTENKEMLDRAPGGRYYLQVQQGNATAKEAARNVKKQVLKTVQNNGFYTNFMHWNDEYKNSKDSLIKGITIIEPLFDAIRSGFTESSRNSGLDYNEAIEYLYGREAIDSLIVTYFDNNSLEIDIWKSAKRNRDYSRIDTPITISSDKRILNGAMNIELTDRVPSAYIDKGELLLNVVLDFSKEHETIEVDLKGTDKITPIENNLVLSLEGQTSVYATNEAKFVLFRRKKDAKDYAVEVVEREQSFSEKYNLPNLEDGYDYFCGAIDKRRQSTLIEL